MNKVWRILGLTTFLMIVALFLAGTGTRAAGETLDGPIVGQAIDFQVSPAVNDLPQRPEEPGTSPAPSRINPLANEPDQGRGGTWERNNVPVDPLISRSLSAGNRTPTLGFDFEGTGNPTACGGCAPPDTNGDVGPNHYIQMVNATKVAIFDKAGTPLNTPYDLGDLWSSGVCNSNRGDPIVLYDPLADRWLLSQFAEPNHMCIAISQTPNPLGVFYLYTFDVTDFPDYFKFGVWPDGYYMSANESSYTAYAFDRAKMLAGDMTATFQKFTGQTNLLLPGDLDGATPPPAGAPNNFYTFKDSTFHGGAADRIELFEFHVDWATPANSTFGSPTTFNIAPFTYTVCGFFNLDCIQQLGTIQDVDAVSEWPMFRFPYRNFGDHQALVGTFTVGGGLGEEGAAIRWFELRKVSGGWTLYQEGTYDPGDGHDRFMGSIAMDQAGDIALGFSVSSSTMNPAIRYATRIASDPLGTLQAEAVLINGGGSQTGVNRWGDYSAMAVDPADDCSFWYTNEYYPASAAATWKTRIGVFTIPDCAPDITVDPTSIVYAQAPDVQVTLPLTITNTGGADLDWTVNEVSASAPVLATPARGAMPGESAIDGDLSITNASFDPPTVVAGAELVDNVAFGVSTCTPSDIPWASVNPSTGTTPGSGSSVLDVTFDSTGLSAPAVYTGTLCIGSNDPDQPLVEVPLTLNVENYSVELSGDQAKSGNPGETITYTLAITNTGTTTDTYDISASSVWTAMPSDSSVTLPANASSSFSVAVDIAAGAADGSSDVATITATSQSDVSATDSVDLTTTAEWHRTYLPVILKN